MYARTWIYRAYSIVTMILGALGFLGSIGSIVYVALLDLNFSPQAVFIKTAAITAIAISALISLFYCYVEFSSMYVFADMIQHEKSNSTEPMRKKGFIMPGKFYSGFGLFIFAVPTVCTVLASLFLIITQSMECGCFVAIPVLPIVIMVIPCVLYYINYFIRYRAIGDLIQVVTVKEPKEQQKQRINDISTGWLRGYSGFLFVFCGLVILAAVIGIFMLFNPVLTLLGLPLAITAVVLSLLSTALTVICIGIYGCYLDNIAKMVEHQQIRFGLFEKVNNK